MYASALLGIAAFCAAGALAPALGFAAVWQLLRGRFRLATVNASLCAASLGVLTGCFYLFNTQPVVWPWAAEHIPAYAIALVAMGRIFSVHQKWGTAKEGCHVQSA